MKKVGVVGAGIAGLVTAKTFLQQGFEVTVFEASRMLGGVWDRSRSYPGVETQTPRDQYAFSDFPMPPTYPEWPSGEQVQAYLEDYARHFGVAERIRYRARVEHAARRPDGKAGFRVRVAVTGADGARREETQDVDFLAVCNGLFHTPNRPRIEGEEAFVAEGGQVLHSSELTDVARVAGKRLVVVGFAKSATDIAMLGLAHASETTLLYRKAAWKVPRLLFGKLPLKNALLTRIGESLNLQPRPLPAERLLHSLGRPLLWLNFRLMEAIFRRQFQLDACDMVPDEPMEHLGCSLGVAPDGFYEAVRSGALRTRRGEIERFVPGGVVLGSGERLAADAVVFATGFKQGIPFLDEPERRKIVDASGHFHLYRGIVHPDVPSVGFVGYNSSLFCQLNAEIDARWLAEHEKGRVRPSREHMWAEMKQDEYFRTAKRPVLREHGGTCVAPFAIHRMHELLREMGAKTRVRGMVEHLTKVLDPAEYQEMLASIPA